MAQAQNLLVNGSFELGAFVGDGHNTMSLQPGSTVMTGWTTISGELAWINDTNNFGGVFPSDGHFSLDLLGYHDSFPAGGVQQSVATIPNEIYHLTFDLGGLTNVNGNFSVQATAGSTTQVFSFNPVAAGGVGYGSFDLPFTATSSSTIISLVGTASGSGNYIALDNVSVTGAVAPGPGALLTTLIGAMPGATILLRRRRSKSLR